MLIEVLICGNHACDIKEIDLLNLLYDKKLSNNIGVSERIYIAAIEMLICGNHA